jgi:carbohydrate-selective porin OprB
MKRIKLMVSVAVAVCICSLIAVAGASASPANPKSQVGLCSDFLQLQQPSPADFSTAFATLIAQNGGIAATTTYCTALVNG